MADHINDVQDERAQWAWKQVAVAADLPKISARYGTLTRKLPSYLQVNGLGQTLAFLYSKRRDTKGRTGDGLLLVQLGLRLAKEVSGSRSLTEAEVDPDPAPVMAWLVGLTPDGYRRASHEARCVAEWLKRFAEGRLEEEKG